MASHMEDIRTVWNCLEVGNHLAGFLRQARHDHEFAYCIVLSSITRSGCAKYTKCAQDDDDHCFVVHLIADTQCYEESNSIKVRR